MAALFLLHPDLRSEPDSAEVKAFHAQRLAIDEYRLQCESALGTFRAELLRFKTEAEEWKQSDQEKAASLCKRYGEELEDQKQRLDWRHKEQADSIVKWRADTEQDFVNLRNVFKDQLRLEEPARYWKDLETKYARQGIWGVVGTLFFALVIALLGGFVVYRPPAILNSNQFTLGGFKGALILAAAGSALLYAINFLIRLTTSSFHLARDARERYQLTHVYLALRIDDAMAEKEREIVLSALFSRSDTGLLKGDSGPSFPPTPLGTIIEHISRTKG